MTRTHRYEDFTETRKRTVEQLECDVCGLIQDIVALDRPNGWATMFRTVDAQRFTWDFCSWPCVVGFVEASKEDNPDGPGSLYQRLEEAVAQKRMERADKTAANYMEEAWESVLASGEQEREE